MSFYEELDKLFESGDLEKIEAFLNTELKEAHDAGNIEAEIAVLNEAGGFYRGISKYDLAQQCFDDAVKRMVQLGQGDTYACGIILMNSAGSLRMAGDPEKAASLFLDVKKTFEACCKKDDYAFVSLLNNLSLCYLDLGDNKNALAAAEEALAIVRRGQDYEHEIATSLNNVAAIRIRMGDHEEALSLLEEALQIYDAMPEENVHHAAALNSAAVVLDELGRTEEALKKIRKAEELNQQFFGKNNDHYRMKENETRFLEKLGKTTEAGEIRREIEERNNS